MSAASRREQLSSIFVAFSLIIFASDGPSLAARTPGTRSMPKAEAAERPDERSFQTELELSLANAIGGTLIPFAVLLAVYSLVSGAGERSVNAQIAAIKESASAGERTANAQIASIKESANAQIASIKESTAAQVAAIDRSTAAQISANAAAGSANPTGSVLFASSTLKARKTDKH